jgi:hypothetical protein
MDTGAIDAIFIILSALGGVSAIIGAAGWAKAERIRAERQGRAAPAQDAAQEGTVLAELKAMQQQMAEMHSTSHGFDLAFDEALNRLEGRVSRLETKAATPAPATDAGNVLRNGQGG